MDFLEDLFWIILKCHFLIYFSYDVLLRGGYFYVLFIYYLSL